MFKSFVRKANLQRFLKAIADHRLSSARRRHGADAGDAARHRNHWDAAIAHYQDYLEKRPHDIGVRVRLANTMRESGDVRNAIAILRAAMADRPDKPRIQLTLADALDEAGSFSEADELRRRLTGVGEAGAIAYPESPTGAATPAAPAIFAGEVLVVVHARRGEEGLLSTTLASLKQLVSASWSVLLSGEFDDALVEDLRIQNPRVRRVPTDGSYEQRPRPCLRVVAGAVVTDNLINWLFWSLTDCVSAVYCDHEELGETGDRRAILQSSPHVLDLATNPKPPAYILYRNGMLDAVLHHPAAALFEAFRSGTVRHVPLTLGAAPDCEDVVKVDWPLVDDPETQGRLLIVIPTRDEGVALDGMLNSLLDRASNRTEIDIVVVNNGSRDAHTIEILDGWRRRGVEILHRDEPFNWSKLNNDACQGRDHSILVFANNDMEMLSEDWDLKVRKLLAVDSVGVVGARLLYPNGRVQHAGIVMGALNGEPLHEGLRVAPNETGPLDRWVRCRPATAVTGAFMAMRRSVFDQVGGFDAENFAVSCNDVDFCLRTGQAGWTVLYAPQLELRHHESLSRGHSDNQAKQQRAAQEMSRLLDRWGARALVDPTRNPQWHGRGIRLFAEMRHLRTEDVVDWVTKTERRPRSHDDRPTFM